MTLDLTDAEAHALAKHLRRAIDYDPYPLAPRLTSLKAILAKLEPTITEAIAAAETRHEAEPEPAELARQLALEWMCSNGASGVSVSAAVTARSIWSSAEPSAKIPNPH
jgi:hypothetical protein